MRACLVEAPNVVVAEPFGPPAVAKPPSSPVNAQLLPDALCQPVTVGWVPLGPADPVITQSLNAVSSLALATRGMNRQFASVDVAASVVTDAVAVDTIPVTIALYGVPLVRAPEKLVGWMHQLVP